MQSSNDNKKLALNERSVAGVGNYLPPTLNSLQQKEWNNQYNKLKEANLVQGEPMSIEDALGSENGVTLVNPNFKNSVYYQKNCDTCCLAYDMRRRGFDVEALPNLLSDGNPVFDFSFNSSYGWILPNGNVAEFTKIVGTEKEIYKKMGGFLSKRECIQ